MKSTGIVRRVDDLGRVVIPKEIRRTLNIKEGNLLELYVYMSDKEHPMLCLTKYTSNDGYNVLEDFIARLEHIKNDWYYVFNNDDKETVEKVSKAIKLLKDNKDKFDF